LNTEFFIANRISRDKDSRNRFSGSITGIAIFGIALGLAVMIVAISMVTGFKKEIRNKVIGFGSHIQILNYDSNLSFETKPVSSDPPFLNEIKNLPEVSHVQVFGLKAGIIKTENDIQGLVLKGVGSDYDWSFFNKSMIEGTTFTVNDTALSNQIVISTYIARKLKLKVGDSFQMWFIQETPRFRKFTISGIYETSLQEFDKTFALADIKHIQKLAGWEQNQVSGLEMTITDFNLLQKVTEQVGEIVSTSFFPDGSRLKVENIVEKNGQIFDWLNLQDINVMIIIILMLVVSGFNMISGLLILILDRTNMIGILKALGTTNQSIRKIFLYQSAYMILKGLFWGNILGLLICGIQKKFAIIKLDPTSYYLSTVPINFDAFNILVLNVGTIAIIMIFLLLPSMLITRISPAEAIRFN
jgi:lipoprotein-releasing system permease protein